jgi:hypothetical protein
MIFKYVLLAFRNQMNPPKARSGDFWWIGQGFISRLRRRLPSAVTGKGRLVRTYVETQKASTDFWRVHLISLSDGSCCCGALPSNWLLTAPHSNIFTSSAVLEPPKASEVESAILLLIN